MKISDLSKLCGYEYFGEDGIVNSIKYFDSADENSIAIIKNKQDILRTRAKCLLMQPIMLETEKTVIYSHDSLEIAAIKIARTLIKNEDISDYENEKYTANQDFYIGRGVSIGKNSIISPNVYIGSDVWIGEDCYIEPNVRIGSGTRIGDSVHIAFGSSIGARSFYHYFEDGVLKEFVGIGGTIIGDYVSIGSNSIIQRGTFSDTKIEKYCKIGNLIDIGHDVKIGEGTKVVSQTGIASMVEIGKDVTIFGKAGIANGIKIGNGATIIGGSGVTKNIPSNAKVSGNPARNHYQMLRVQAKLLKLKEE